MKQHLEIAHYVNAGYPLLYILTHEPQRVQRDIYEVCNSTERQYFYWSVSSGLARVNKANGKIKRFDVQAPEEILDAIANCQDGEPDDDVNVTQNNEESPILQRSIIILHNFHMYLKNPDPFLYDKLYQTIKIAKANGVVMIVVGCTLNLPPEIEKEVAVIDFKLPDKKELGDIMRRVCKDAGVKLTGKSSVMEQCLDAAQGLTMMEAENAFALSCASTGDIKQDIVNREKTNIIKKTGLLEIIDTDLTFNDIGGQEFLLKWMTQRRNAFSKEAKVFGLPSPKGVLIVGVPGTGKTLCSKATANLFGKPLVKLDPGKIFGGVVGESESNLRHIIKTVEAIAPCVLMIDEIEKGFSGSKSSNTTDGGTSSRVFGTFISWMQDKKADVFVVATANDIGQLPPEFLRKGRFDELWFVDLPNTKEREQIWDIQLKKYNQNPTGFDLPALVRESDGMTGAEIEQSVIDAMYFVFDKDGQKGKVGTDDVLYSIRSTAPLSQTMKAEIRAMQSWAEGRARLASTREERKESRSEGRVINVTGVTATEEDPF